MEKNMRKENNYTNAANHLGRVLADVNKQHGVEATTKLVDHVSRILKEVDNFRTERTALGSLLSNLSRSNAMFIQPKQALQICRVIFYFKKFPPDEREKVLSDLLLDAHANIFISGYKPEPKTALRRTDKAKKETNPA